MRRRLLLAATVLSQMLLAGAAGAQDVAAADALFKRGLADLDAGRYDAACDEIAESQRLDPRPGTLFTLAVCEMQRGRVATAVTYFGDYLSAYDNLPPAQKARQGKRPREAKARREKLLPDVPELSLVLPPGAPEGTVVRRDGTLVAKAALGVSLPVDPGEHAVETQAPGGPATEQRFTLAKGEKKQLTLEVKAAPPMAERTTPPPARDASAPSSDRPGEGASAQRVATYLVGGVGIAGLALGGATGFMTLKKKQTIKAHCGSGIHVQDETACDATGLDAVNQAKPLSLLSTIGFAVGAAGVGTGLLLLLTEPSRPRSEQGRSARWTTAGVLRLGPDGGVLGVGGAW